MPLAGKAPLVAPSPVPHHPAEQHPAAQPSSLAGCWRLFVWLRLLVLGIRGLVALFFSLLRVALQSYAWSRRLLDCSLVGEALAPTAGIGAGSAFATYELQCLVALDLAALQAHRPAATISLHVDICCS